MDVWSDRVTIQFGARRLERPATPPSDRHRCASAASPLVWWRKQAPIAPNFGTFPIDIDPRDDGIIPFRYGDAGIALLVRFLSGNA